MQKSASGASPGFRSGTDLDLTACAVGFNHGHMLFLGAVDGLVGHKFHGLATAGKRAAAAGEKHFDDIAAEFTLIDFKLVSHENLPYDNGWLNKDPVFLGSTPGAVF